MAELDLVPGAVCRSCGADGLHRIHRQTGVPANSCLLLPTREEAAAFPRGEIDLGLCPSCGFVGNMAFDPGLAEYSSRYEETQGFSARFVEFATALAGRWVERYHLTGRSVLEIGCGKGEFLVLMAEAGIGSGIGIDPGVHVERIASPAAARLEWIADFYDDDYAHLQADAIVCRHTLEHIADVGDFVGTLRRNIGDRRDTVVLFELPDTQRVLDEVAFWDVYYEHCSYFSEGSLARLFERSGFRVLDLYKEYDDQYLILEAQPVAADIPAARWPADDMDDLRRGAEHFASGFERTIGGWRTRLAALTGAGGRAVIWGAGSKGVAFLVETGDHIAAAVDINPYKHGMHMAGTGHRIVAPVELQTIRPDLVVVMNPIYIEEITADLDSLGLQPEIVAV